MWQALINGVWQIVNAAFVRANLAEEYAAARGPLCGTRLYDAEEVSQLVGWDMDWIASGERGRLSDGSPLRFHPID